MILQRLTHAFRKQDWFTVLIETLIVVLGVFLGLQVNNWNTSRTDHALEREYLLRLHDEIATLVDEQESFRAEVVERTGTLDEVATYLNDFGTQQATALLPSGPHCRAVISSHIYAGDIILPPTISELLATGRITIISDDALRMQIIRFAQAIDEIAQLRHDIQLDRIVLSRKYPDLIALSPADREESLCDFPGMAQSQAFRNDFLDNLQRFRAYSTAVIQNQQDLRQDLQASIDRALSIKPEASSQ